MGNFSHLLFHNFELDKWDSFDIYHKT